MAAGDKVEVIKGPVTTIRAKALKKGAKGDMIRISDTYGFWLHGVKKGEVVDFCVSAPIISIPNSTPPAAYVAGKVFQVTGVNGVVNYAPAGAELNKQTPYRLMIVYRAAKATDDRILVTWGLY